MADIFDELDAPAPAQGGDIFDKLDAPAFTDNPVAAPQREVGVLESAGRSLKDAAYSIAELTNRGLSVMPAIVDAAAGAVGFEPKVQERWEQTMVAPAAAEREEARIDPETETQDFLSQLASTTGPMVRDVGAAVLTGGAAPAAQGVKAGASLLEILGPIIGQGVAAMSVPSGIAGMDAQTAARESGADESEAVIEGAKAQGRMLALGAAPMAATSGAASPMMRFVERLYKAAPIVAGQNEAVRAGEGLLTGEGYEFDPQRALIEGIPATAIAAFAGGRTQPGLVETRARATETPVESSLRPADAPIAPEGVRTPETPANAAEPILTPETAAPATPDSVPETARPEAATATEQIPPRPVEDATDVAAVDAGAAAVPEGLNGTAPRPVPDEVPVIAAEAPAAGEAIPARTDTTAEGTGTATEPMSPGPGAASAKEPLASYELRRFGKRFQEDQSIAPEVREETGNRYYEPISNKVTVTEAESIIEARGTEESIRLVRDESFQMEPRVRTTMAQGLVKKLNQSYAEARAAGDTPRAQQFLNQAVETTEYLSEYATRLGQGVQSMAIWSRLTPEGMLESARRTAKKSGVDLTPEQTAEIAKLTQEINDAPEGMPKQEAMGRFSKYMVDKSGLPAKDLPIAIYYSNILSGINTQVVNVVDTSLNVLHEVNSMALSNPKAAAQIYAGLVRGLGEGRYDSLVALSEGRRITSGKFAESPDILEASNFGTKGGVPIAAAGPVSRLAKKVVESPVAKPMNAYKYVMRVMAASDTTMFRAAEEARAGLLAYRLAESTGVKRAKLRAEADSILGFDRLPEFREQATREGYSGAKAEARATELMIQSRPEALREDAANFAGVTTYNHEPAGMLGYFANQMGKASNEYPVLKLFVPFTRIVANVTNRGLANTPWGYRRALAGGKDALTGDAKQQALVRATAGTAAMVGIGVMSANGIITLHGAGPSNPDKKRQLQSAGWKPYSIQIGDKYFTYTYSPIGLGLSVMGNYLDSQQYNELGQKDAMTRTAYSVSRIGSTVFNQSFLSGMSNLFEILSGNPGKTISSLKNFFASTVTGATTPTLLRDVNGIFDPAARKSDNIAQDMVRNIPVARLALKPTLNAYGEPVIPSRNRFFSQQKEDPAWKIVVEKNLRLPIPDDSVFRDAEDGYEYSKDAGQNLKRYVVKNLARLRAAPPEAAQDDITRAARNIFDEARARTISRGGVRREKKRPSGQVARQ